MDVSVENQFKEKKSNIFLYFGLVLFSAFLMTIFGYLNFAKAASSPSVITYQGKLLNGGAAVTTTQAIKYVLYDAVSSGNALYSAAGSTSSPSTVSTTVNDGFFTIDLGDTGTNSIDPVIFKDNQTVYLQITVGGENLSPRKRITASPFALNAKYLDGIGASSTPQSSSYIPVSDNSGNFNLNHVTSTGIYINGLLSVTGNSSFGTITSGTWNGSVISNAYGGTGQNSSGWTGFVKVVGGTWATSTISVSDISNSSTLAFLASNQTFSGLNIFTATTTFASSTFGGYVGIGTSSPQEKLHLYDGTLLVDSPVHPTLLGSYNTTGTVYAVDVSGKYAYVADDTSGLEIFEISAPSNPALIGYYNTAGNAWDVKVSGKYAYVADNTDGLLIFDISIPSTPVLVGSYDTAGNATSVYISGKYAYVADVSSLTVVDISNPKNPILASRLSSVAPVKVYISGEYAYMAKTGGGGLSIVNIDNPLNPVLASTTVRTSNSSDVYVSGRYAYLAAGLDNKVVVYDISVPTVPVEISSMSTNGSAQGVYVSGRYAYVTDATTFYVFNLSNGSLIGTYPINDGNGLKIVGKNAYVANGTSGLYVLDIKGADISSANIGNIATNDLTVWENVNIGNSLSIKNGLNIGMGGLLSNGAIAVTVSTTISTSTLFSVGTSTPSILSVMGDGKVGIGTSSPQAKLHLYNGTLLVDNPKTLSLLGSVSSSTLDGIYGSYVSGNYAYAVASTGTLSVIDIQTKTSPAIVGFYASSTIGTAFAIAGSGNFVYVPSTLNSSLNVFDVSNPSSPLYISSVTDATKLNNPAGLYADGKYVYVVCYTGGGLTIIDVKNPAVPIITGRVTSTIKLNSTEGVYVAGKYAYVIDNTSLSVFGTLTIVDVSNVRSPNIIGFVSSTSLRGGGDSEKVYVSGRYAYVTGNLDNVLSIIDVSNPTAPTIVGSLADNSYGFSSGVFVSGKYAYVGTVNNLLVVDISNKAAPVLVGVYAHGSATVGAHGYAFAGKYAYVSGNTNDSFGILDLEGAEISTADIGNLSTNALTVWENSDIGNSLFVRNSLSVGAGGIISNGPISIFVSSTASPLFTIATSTNSSVFSISSSGNVEINTSSFGGGNTFSYKLLIDAGSTSNGAIGVNGFIRATSYVSGTTTLDLAETYPVNMLCTANGTCPTDGDVVCTDPTVIAGVKKCLASESSHIVGIVSANPGFLLGGGDLFNPNQNLGVVKVALAGRVPTKVSSINGEINSGDKLTLSNIDGVAAKAVGEVPIVGIAMENFSGSGEGSIVVFVSLGWQNQLYQSLTVNTDSSTLSVGSDVTPYNLALSGEFTMFNSVLNKLVFNATALFESKTNDTHAFIFNAINFDTSTDKYLLSLRSNNDPRFSVMANGDVRASGNIYAASAVFGTSSNPGDLAERVDIAADDIVEPGDVLVVDKENPDTYRRSGSSNQQTVAGVVSTNPTIVVGNGKTEYTAILAMVGRVPLKVSGENGAINRGDLLVTASSSGYAMKYDPKKDNNDNMVGVVGVALDSFVGDKGKIMALVRTGWVNSRYETISSIKDNIQQLATAQGIVLGATSTVNLNVENNNGQLIYSGGDLNLQGNMLLNVAAISSKNNHWSIDESGHFITRLNTSQGEKEMFAIQSPTSEFVFSSSSQLIAGEAKVAFDQTMQDMVDSNQPLKINVTLTSGEAKGIYVAEKNSQGFIVKELDGGKSDATFDWIVVAKRKDETTSLNIIEIATSTGNNQITNNQVSTSTNDTVTSSIISNPFSSADNSPQSLASTSSPNTETTLSPLPISSSETISPVVVPVETVAASTISQ